MIPFFCVGIPYEEEETLMEKLDDDELRFVPPYMGYGLDLSHPHSYFLNLSKMDVIRLKHNHKTEVR